MSSIKNLIRGTDDLIRRLWTEGPIQGVQVDHTGHPFKLHEVHSELPRVPIEIRFDVLPDQLTTEFALILHRLATTQGMQFTAVAGVPNGNNALAQALAAAFQLTLITLEKLPDDTMVISDEAWCNIDLMRRNDVLLVENVITTAESAIRAAAVLCEATLDVAGLVAPVTWDIGGEEHFRQEMGASAACLCTGAYVAKIGVDLDMLPEPLLHQTQSCIRVWQKAHIV